MISRFGEITAMEPRTILYVNDKDKAVKRQGNQEKGQIYRIL